MNRTTWKFISSVFVITFIISVCTLRDIRNTNELIKYAFERQMLGFINAIFVAIGSLFGLWIYERVFKKKV